MMYGRVLDADLNIFHKPARLLICGNSGSGKSSLVVALLQKYRNNFDLVVVIGADLEGVESLDIKRDDDFNPLLDAVKGEKTLVIFDDCIFNQKQMKVASESFVRARHLGVSLIFLSQNLYLQDRNYRVIGLNVTHVFLLKQRDLKQIILYAKSFLEDNLVQKFVDVYKKIVLKIKYNYILIDFTKDYDSPLLIRSNLTGETYEKAYQL